MKTKTLTMFAAILLLTINSTAFCRSTDLEKQILKGKNLLYEAYLKYDELTYMQAYSVFERILSVEPENELATYYLTFAQYRLIVLAMNRKENDKFDKYYELALKNCKKLESSTTLANEADILKAAILMMKLANAPMQAPILSPTINSTLDKILASDSLNTRALLIKGVMDYNTPAFFGGSVENAITRFNKAITVFESTESDKENLNPDWGYIETLAWLGQAYAKAEKIDKAKETYEKALSVEPNFGWVRGFLLPALTKNQN